MTFRMVAGLSARWRMRDIVRDPTGSPVSMYARTIRCRISRSLGLSSLPDNIVPWLRKIEDYPACVLGAQVLS